MRIRTHLPLAPTQLLATLLALLAVACARTGAGPTPPGPVPDAPALPPIPTRDGPLALDLVYPPEEATVPATDSTFVFGSTGTGRASLAINGTPVPVEPNGAFLAFLPVPADGVYRLRAEAAGRSVTLERVLEVPAVPEEPPERARLVTGSLAPRGAHVVRRGELVTVRFRGAAGGRARVILPDSTVIAMTERAVETGPPTGFMEAGRDAPRRTEYVATFPLEVPLHSADTAVAVPTLLDPGAAAGEAVVELVVGTDSVWAPLPATIALLDPGVARVGEAVEEDLSGVVTGVAAPPPGTPYHWFFPTGTRLALTGERPGVYRVRLTDDLSVWVPQSEVRLLDPSLREVSGSVGNVRVTSRPGWDEVRVSLSEPFPFHVRPEGDALSLSIYGAQSRTNWMYLPTDGSLIEALDWEQPASDEYLLRVELADPVWGWDTRWEDDGTLLLRVRRPPPIDRDAPLRGIRVAVDAGHPPGGAIGPTRLTEAEANLDISRKLAAILEEEGANVVRIRFDTAALGLYERVVQAERADAHLFVSVHNNAFGDGVNPYENAGTSVLYNRAHSLRFARWLQRHLLAELGLRDLGVIFADRAVIRNNTWMPSVLTESMFLMVPRQEAALRDPGVQERIARAHARAIAAFLAERAERP